VLFVAAVMDGPVMCGLTINYSI